MLTLLKKIKNYLSHKIQIFFEKMFKKIKSLGRSKKINNYLKNNELKKLHLGCSRESRKGWLPTDLVPQSSNVIYLDASDQLPFEDYTFDYIYCEHMIEHINYFQAKKMLIECFRILKSGGKIRIATPDLDKYLSLIIEKNNSNNKSIINFYMNKLFTKYPNNENSVFHILNLEMHSWGHKYIYNYNTLSEQLLDSGFLNIKKQETGQSDDIHLQNLEMHGENFEKIGLTDDVDFFKFETIIVEAIK